MIRFLYIADSHIGADPIGYHQQPAFPRRLPEILHALVARFSPDGGLDFVLHGGDMIDATTTENIRAAVEVFDLPFPVYLCLGNHDLTTPDAVERWLRLAPDFFANGHPTFTIRTDHCVVHVVPNQWCRRPYYWENEQTPQLSAAQVRWLTHELQSAGDRPHLLVTHSPVFGLPVEQTGLSEPCHAPPPAFTDTMTGIASDHSHLRCVLGAHNHMNMHIQHGGAHYVTVSALVEAPFECKLFEVSPRLLRMTTVSLVTDVGIPPDYDAGRSFVQGRAIDRAFTARIRRIDP